MAGENINRRINIYINGKEVVNSLGGVEREMAKVRNQMKHLNEGTEDYDKKLAELKNTYKKLQNEQARFRADLGQTQSFLQKVKSTLGPIATGFLAAFSITALVGAAANKIRQAANIVVEFDQRQASLAAIMGKTRLQVAGLTADAIKYGATTAYSATQVSDLQTELARLGKTAPEIRAMTKDVLNSATALETDLASAAVLVGGQLNSFGESASQAGKFSDIMANSANISATSYEYLATALPKASAVAAQGNVTFEKLNAVMGVLADQNIQAETAGTGFRNILLESAKAGKPYQEMLDAVKNSANQGKKAVELFGKENATVAVILANSTKKINDQTEALENSAGSAEKLAKEKMNSIKGAVEGFSGAWEGFILSIEQGDGPVSKAIRGFLNLGSAALNALSPMQQLSDQIEKEQLGLNSLVSKITSTNTKQAERKQLLIELKNEYPDFIKNIDIEKVSNSQLEDELNKVNEQYVKRIALQRIVEKLEAAQKDQGDFLSQKLEKQNDIFEKLNQIKGQFALKVKIDFDDLKGSAARVRKALEAKGEGTGRMRGVESDLEMLHRMEVAISRSTDVVKKRTEEVDRSSKSLGIETEAQRAATKATDDAAKALQLLREEALKAGMKNAMTAPEKDVKLWLDAWKERQKIKDQESDEDAKKRQKAIDDAKQHTADLQNQLEVSEKELLETKRAFQDLNLDLAQEGFRKEREQLNTEYDRKIEDVKIKINQEQDEIKKLEAAKKDPKNSKQDVKLLQQQIDNKIQIIKQYNDTTVSLEQTRNLKLAALQEKYIQKDLKDKQEANERDLQNLQTRHNFELAAIDSLQKAKAFLSDSLSADELRKVTTLEQAKKIIKEKFLQEEYDLQIKQLTEMMAGIQAIFKQEESTGIQLISPEQREVLLQFLDEVAHKLSELGVAKAESGTEAQQPQDLSSLNGVDILGFSPEQWNQCFDNLDTFAGKMAALETVIGGIKNAFGMYFSFVDASDQRSLQRFQKNTDRKKRDLTKQLEHGFITQEVYNARVQKLDDDLQRKQAQLEYKKAKRQKIMSVLEIVTNTGIAVAKAIAASPLTMGMPWAGIIAGMGALQLASVLAQPLPPKDGFKDGGYTGDGSPDAEAGPVHKREYVIPQHVLFGNDPAMPNILSYLEEKRTGKRAAQNSSADSMPASSSASGGSPVENLALAAALNRIHEILDRIEKNGLTAILENDLKNAKKLYDKQKELAKLKTDSKA